MDGMCQTQTSDGKRVKLRRIRALLIKCSMSAFGVNRIAYMGGSGRIFPPIFLK
jgi:hypothetical protein